MSEEWLSVINGNEVSSKGRADADEGQATDEETDGPVTHFSLEEALMTMMMKTFGHAGRQRERRGPRRS